MNTLVQIIQTVGFPIVVCGWFMLRLEKRLEQLTIIHGRIEDKLEQLSGAINGLSDTQSPGRIALASKRNV